MRARKLLDASNVGFSADTANAVNQAFLNAWAQLSPSYSDIETIGKARLKLAECILAVTRDGNTNVDQIQRLALAMFRTSN